MNPTSNYWIQRKLTLVKNNHNPLETIQSRVEKLNHTPELAQTQHYMKSQNLINSLTAYKNLIHFDIHSFQHEDQPSFCSSSLFRLFPSRELTASQPCTAPSCNYSFPCLLLIDASTKMNLKKDFDKVIEFKGEHAPWNENTESRFTPALYPFTVLLINVLQEHRLQTNHLTAAERNMSGKYAF